MPPSHAPHRLSAVVSGRVQGVGYRYFTREQARSLGLTGWVRNEPDGSVRVEAEGSRDALDALVEALHRGPSAARVRRVTTQWSAATDAFVRFTVER